MKSKSLLFKLLSPVFLVFIIMTGVFSLYLKDNVENSVFNSIIVITLLSLVATTAMMSFFLKNHKS